jgi:hypothetical protein
MKIQVSPCPKLANETKCKRRSINFIGKCILAKDARTFAFPQIKAVV